MPSLQVVDFPPELHRELRIEALRRGVPLRDLVCEVLRAVAATWEGSKLGLSPATEPARKLLPARKPRTLDRDAAPTKVDSAS